MINPGSKTDLKLNLCCHFLTEHHQQQRSHQCHQHQLINTALQFLMPPRDLQTPKLSPNTHFGDKKSIPQIQQDVKAEESLAMPSHPKQLCLC